ncbi:MAG: sigma-70 family RNA polymerase sigma factor [Myxococcales bacterium]|nr:sigma-70 family RNA polymerase sigma factor [Myxococcales bacterium]
MNEASTAALVGQARAGSARAFEVLVRRHLRAAYSVALAVLRVPAEAEDVAQEALVVAWEKLAECREPERFAGWLIHIARNTARNALEKRSVRESFAKVSAANEVAEESVSSRVDARTRLLAALSHLDERAREVVLLHDLEGWSHGEIADALELSEVNSRQLLFGARKTLRAHLADEANVETSHGP